MDKIKSIIQRRTKLINDLSDQLDADMIVNEKKILKEIFKELKKLEVKDGVIVNNLKNKGLLLRVDAVMNKFRNNEAAKTIQDIVDGANKLGKLNKEYFQTVSSTEKIKKLQDTVQKEIAAQLGYDTKGNILEGGMLHSVSSDKTLDNKIKNFIRKAIITEQEVDLFKENLEIYVAGDGDKKVGVIEKHYKETTADVFAQVDRLNGYVYSNGLNLKFAIYEGGLIKTSRDFCIKKNGKVFHITEIMKFDPKVAKQPNYNPIIDLGGYNCRHHLNWIGDELAVRLRPDAKKFLKAA